MHKGSIIRHSCFRMCSSYAVCSPVFDTGLTPLTILCQDQSDVTYRRRHSAVLGKPQIIPLALCLSYRCLDTATSSSTGGAASATDHAAEGPRDTMQKAAAARREIFDLWAQVGEWESEGVLPSTGATDHHHQRFKLLQAILDKYQLSVLTPLEEDVTRGLGDALDRLVLLCLPMIPPSNNTEEGKKETDSAIQESSPDEAVPNVVSEPMDVLERVLQLASRQGRRLSVRLVQHLFARTQNYAEALSVFHMLRRTHFAMNMETYHAMLYSLQRLEEEGWAQRFREEYLENTQQTANHAEGQQEDGGGVSEQAMEFILRGVQSPLMPENKPWLGRIMYENGAGGENHDEEETRVGEKSASTFPAAVKQTTQSWDELGSLWMKRYRKES